jgi:hypothetical protein
MKLPRFDQFSDDQRNVQRQAFAGLLWSKQYYRFDVTRWLGATPPCPKPPPGHQYGRNRQWKHLDAATSFPCPTSGNIPGLPPGIWPFTAFPSAIVDPDFAKHQLDPDDAGMVHAPQWPDSSLRMGLWRCESARSRLGHLAKPTKLSKRDHNGKGDIEFLEYGFFKSCC